MPNAAVQSASGSNPEAAIDLHRKAFKMRVEGMVYTEICKALPLRTTGLYAGRPYTPGTVHTWVKKELAKNYPADKRLAESMRQLEDARLERNLAALEPQLRTHEPCLTCGRGGREASPVAIRTAVTISERKASLHGLDAPRELAVYDASMRQLEEANALYRRVILDTLPTKEAHALLYALEVAACEADGVAPPAKEVKDLRAIEGKVEP